MHLLNNMDSTVTGVRESLLVRAYNAKEEVSQKSFFNSFSAMVHRAKQSRSYENPLLYC